MCASPVVHYGNAGPDPAVDFRRPDRQTGFRYFVVQGFERMDALLLAARLILAAVFVVSGISKLFDLSGSQAAMRSFGVPERLTRAGGIVLPIAEMVIAVLLIPVATAKWGALLALILLAVFIAGISYSLSRGPQIRLPLFWAVDDV